MKSCNCYLTLAASVLTCAWVARAPAADLSHSERASHITGTEVFIDGAESLLRG